MNRYQADYSIDNLVKLSIEQHDCQNEIHQLFERQNKLQENTTPNHCILYSWLTEESPTPKEMSNIYLYADKWIKKNASKVAFSHIEIESDFIIDIDPYEGFHKHGTKVCILGTPNDMIFSEEYQIIQKSIEAVQVQIAEKTKQIEKIKNDILKSIPE